MTLLSNDLEIFELLNKERERQRSSLSLIASENIVSKEVMLAVGSELTNKYAEGYPGKRYYGGCQFHDQIETLAISRAKELFNAEHVNVQPHSGSNANMAAYFALAEYGDTVLAMDLDHGGHLTHGSKVNFSGKFFNIVSYGVNRDDQLIDYDAVEALAEQHKPKIIIAGASAYSRIIDFKRFSSIAKATGARFLVDMAHIAGLVAADLHPSPIPYADIVTTTTHKTLRGSRGGMILCVEDLKKAVDSWLFPGLQGGPLMHEIAGKAVCFKEALSPSFKIYQKQVIANAKMLAKSLGDFGFNLVSGGTDNHLILLDLRAQKISGKQAESELDELGLVVNKNKIPFDEAPPTITSGIRLGTPSLTTRGMKENEMQEIASIIHGCLSKSASTGALKERVRYLAERFIA